tara:strand:- start:15071 stop:16693 length:1623 start_codon:yes stop_codon:yes gene_type:complete
MKLFLLLTIAYSLKLPDNNIRKQWTKYRLTQETAKRHTKPNKLNERELNSLDKFGFIYDDETKRWKRKTQLQSNEKVYGRSPQDDGETIEKWKSSIENVFEDDEFIFDPTSISKRKGFTPRPNSKEYMDKSFEIKDNEKLNRLGFHFENNRWVRSAPRNTTTTMIIKSKNRILSVKVIDENTMRVVNRLDYIVSQSLYETPTNIWDGVLRIGSEKTTLFIWFAAQYRLWSIFINNPVILNDAWMDNHNTLPDISSNLIITSGIYFLFTYMKTVIWDESSGSLVYGALERSIVDGLLTNYTLSPASYSKRRQMGITHNFMSSSLRIIASFPRVYFFHGYLQQKIYYNLLALSSLDTLIKDQQVIHSHIVLETCIIMGLIAMSTEIVTSRWSRPPKNNNDEINSIKEAVVMDDIHLNILKKRLDNMDVRRDGKIMIDLVKKQILNTNIENTQFKQLADTWINKMHNKQNVLNDLDNTTIFENDNLFIIKLLTSNLITGTSAAFSYSLDDNLMVPLLINIIGSCVEEFPVFTISSSKNVSITI